MVFWGCVFHDFSRFGRSQLRLWSGLQRDGRVFKGKSETNCRSTGSYDFVGEVGNPRFTFRLKQMSLGITDATQWNGCRLDDNELIDALFTAFFRNNAARFFYCQVFRWLGSRKTRGSIFQLFCFLVFFDGFLCAHFSKKVGNQINILLRQQSGSAIISYMSSFILRRMP